MKNKLIKNKKTYLQNDQIHTFEHIQLRGVFHLNSRLIIK